MCMRLITSILLLSVVAGCRAPIRCGEDLEYDENRHRCICPEPRTWLPDAGQCVETDAGSMSVPLDAGVAESDSGGADGTDAGCARTWYRDADSDSYGNPASAVTSCDAPAGYVANDDDCDDNCAACHPGVAEACDRRDDDCDGEVDEAECRALPAHLWSRRVGGAAADSCTGIGVDASGNVMLVGTIEGPASYGGVEHDRPTRGTFIASYSRDGAYRWSRDYGGIAETAVVHRTGNAYVAGMVAGGTSVGGADLGTNPSVSRAYVAGYDPNGAHRWSTLLPSGTETGMRVAVDDSTGDLLVAGVHEDRSDYGPLVGPDDIFIIRISSEGLVRWSRRLGGTGREDLGSLHVGRDSTIYVGADLSSEARLEATSVGNSAGSGALVALAPDGSFRWALLAEGGVSAVPRAITSGETLVAAAFEFGGTVRVGGREFSSTAAFDDGLDVLLVALDRSGALQSARAFGSVDPDSVRGLHVVGDGLVLVGHSYVDASIDGVDVGGALYVAGLDPSGAARWARPYGLPDHPIQHEGPRSSAMLDDHTVVICGDEGDRINLGGDDLEPIVRTDDEPLDIYAVALDVD